MFETQKLWIGLLLVVLLGPTYAQDRALLVGIDEYQYVSQLRGSKQDVEDMQQFIQSVWGYQSQQIRVLTDASATRRITSPMITVMRAMGLMKPCVPSKHQMPIL